MSQFVDAIARMTIDTEFIRYAHREPERTASLYALTPGEAALLRELLEAATNDRTAALHTLLAEASTLELAVGTEPATTPPAKVADLPTLPTLLTVA